MAKFQGASRPNMAALMKQAQKMQEEMTKAQNELKLMEFTASAGGGAVKLTLSGERKLTSIKIDKELLNPDEAEMIEDLIIAAFNDASEQLEAASGEKLGALTGGMNIPGF